MKTYASAVSALVFATALTTSTSTPSLAAIQACDTSSLLSTVDRGVSGTSPCTLPDHRYMLESGYYQNASVIGGTALAAYPLVHLRYSATPALEVFVEPATAIAKSGLNGAGIYTWSRSGIGTKFRILDMPTTAVALRLDYTPQADETATISTRDRFDAGIIARSALSEKFLLSATIGKIAYTQVPAVAANKTSAWYERLAVSDHFAKRTQVVATMSSQSALNTTSGAQSKYGLTLQQTLAQHALLDVEIGSALNSTGGTKAHYLGAGFTIYPSWQK